MNILFNDGAFLNIHSAPIICCRHNICHLLEGTALETLCRIFQKLETNSVWPSYSLKENMGSSKHLLIFLFVGLSLVSVHNFFLTLLTQSNICVKIFWSMVDTKPLKLNLALIYIVFFFFTQRIMLEKLCKGKDI